MGFFKGFPVTFFRRPRGVLPVWPARCDPGGREICLGPQMVPICKRLRIGHVGADVSYIYI